MRFFRSRGPYSVLPGHTYVQRCQILFVEFQYTPSFWAYSVSSVTRAFSSGVAMMSNGMTSSNMPIGTIARGLPSVAGIEGELLALAARPGRGKDSPNGKLVLPGKQPANEIPLAALSQNRDLVVITAQEVDRRQCATSGEHGARDDTHLATVRSLELALAQLRQGGSPIAYAPSEAGEQLALPVRHDSLGEQLAGLEQVANRYNVLITHVPDLSVPSSPV